MSCKATSRTTTQCLLNYNRATKEDISMHFFDKRAHNEHHKQHEVIKLRAVSSEAAFICHFTAGMMLITHYSLPTLLRYLGRVSPAAMTVCITQFNDQVIYI